MKIGVLGCAGRMGRTTMRLVLESDDMELVGGCEAAGNAALGQDLGVMVGGEAIGHVARDDVAALISSADAVIEFTVPEATVAHAAACARARTVHVIGTTGLSDAQQASLREAATHTPIVWASNMGQGVNLMFGLVEQIARALDNAFDIEIVEMHHRHKIDAPSGTALSLGEAAARGRGVALADVADRGRDGITGARTTGAIGFAALRGGDVVGDHTVVFAADGERIEISHRATDRGIYARGALRAAGWAIGRPPGLYGMADVLGLRSDGNA